MSARELRSEFHLKLDQLDTDLIRMGLLTIEQVERACTALFEGRPEMADQVIANDARLDRMETELEIRCVQLFALEAPVASDLRLISSIFKITADLERIGDHAVKIAYIGKDLKKLGHPGPLTDVQLFSELVVQLLRDTLRAFETRDAVLSREVRARDRHINTHCRTLDDSIVAKMEATPKDIDYYSLLHFIPGRLERIGDHCQNIAERVVYIATGQYLLHESPDA